MKQIFTNKSDKQKKESSFSFLQKRWWDKFDHIYDDLTEKYLWNKDIDPSTYQMTDFHKHLIQDRDRMLDMILYKGNERTNITTICITLNSILASAYAYGTVHTDWFNHWITIAIFYLIGCAICMMCYTQILSSIQQATVYFSQINKYQKYFPTRPFGDADYKVLFETTKTTFRPVLAVQLWLPRLFFGIYTLLTIVNIFELFF